jgi:hypothetical protein
MVSVVAEGGPHPPCEVGDRLPRHRVGHVLLRRPPPPHPPPHLEAPESNPGPSSVYL